MHDDPGGHVTALLIATAGGHLTQLLTLSTRFSVDTDDAVWVSVPTAQSRSVLADRSVIWARYSSPRDIRAFVEHLALARQVLKARRFDLAISTGASLAPAFFAAARSKGLPCHYIESATRVDGPSMSGRLVSLIPGVRLYTQYDAWAGRRWRYGGSIFDQWRTAPRTVPRPLRRAVVTTGSARGFPFSRLVAAARRVLPPDCEVTWQIGEASPEGLTGRVAAELNSAELSAAIADADVIISHAGTGSVITALAAGRCPVLVPRATEYHEHVDNHQFELAAMLAQRELAIVRSPDALSPHDLELAAALDVLAAPTAPFALRP